MHAEIRVAAIVSGEVAGVPVSEVSVTVASLGSLVPARGSQELTLTADGRPVVFVPSGEAAARSASMVFLTVHATVRTGEFLRLITADQVVGRVWGHPFVLAPHQLEILRAYGRAIIDTR